MSTGFDREKARAVLDGFDLSGTMVALEPFGSGHINSTWRSVYESAGTRIRYTHQRINEQVFKRPDQVMENIDRVLCHLRSKIREAGLDDQERRCLRLVRSRTGGSWVLDADGGYWRTYVFIERSKTCEVLESDLQARNIARAVGRFQLMLADLGPPRLHETIPAFHDSLSRFMTFHEILEADAFNRAASVRKEVDWILENEERSGAIIRAMRAGTVPERITHNDTKANNILLDEATDEAICVIDLDTVMPGSLLFDFGDLVRTSAGSAAEDESDSSRMEFNLSRFRSLAAGFIGETSSILSEGERALLGEAGRIVTTIQAVRFLGDHLAGDSYYRIHRPGHNRDRALTQIALVKSMDRRMEEITAICGAAAGTGVA